MRNSTTTRRSFFGLLAGIAACLGLPKGVVAAVDREAKLQYFRQRSKFMDEARPIIEGRMEVLEAILQPGEYGYDSIKPVTYKPTTAGEYVEVETDEPLHVMRATFRSNTPGSSTCIALDTARLWTVRRLRDGGSEGLDRIRRRGLVTQIALAHWDRRIAVR